MDKRDFLKKGLLGAVALVILPSFAKNNLKAENGRKLLIASDLSFAPNALNDFMNQADLVEHHSHFVKITEKLNAILSNISDSAIKPRYILRNPTQFNSEIKSLSGDFINHRVFFKSLTPNSQETFSSDFLNAMNSSFGSVELFKQQFAREALTLQTEGWIWLTYNNNKLIIVSTARNQNPFSKELSNNQQGFPLLGLDLWKHAYSKKHGENIEQYVSTFWKVIDWNFINKRYQVALQSGY